MDLVTVIIPTYNREKTIKRSINSVLNQTYKNFELIVVDDCSSDNTVNLLEQIKDPRLKIIKLEKNNGACYARNVGIKNAKGNYIAFQDSDDEWLPNKLEEQIKNMKNKDSDLDFCSYYIRKKNSKKKMPKFNKKIRIKRYGYEKSLSFGNFIGTPLLIIKKECTNEYMFDNNLPRFQDWDLVLNLSKKFKISFTNKVLANVYVQNDSITRSTDKLKKAINLFEKKEYKYKKILMSTLYSILARASISKEKKYYYKKALKEHFSIKILIKLIINY